MTVRQCLPQHHLKVTIDSESMFSLVRTFSGDNKNLTSKEQSAMLSCSAFALLLISNRIIKKETILLIWAFFMVINLSFREMGQPGRFCLIHTIRWFVRYFNGIADAVTNDMPFALRSLYDLLMFLWLNRLRIWWG